jgi:Autographiviridae putative DNA helicase
LIIYKVIKSFLIKDIFEKYHGVVDKEYIKANFRELSRIWDCLIYLMTESETDKTVEDLELYYHTEYPADLSDQTKLLFKALLAAQIEPESILAYLESFSQYKLAQTIAETAVQVMEGYKDFSHLNDLIALNQPIAVEDEFVTDNLEELYETTYKKQGLRWRLDTLNKSLGSLRIGDFGFVFARPETGKTTFLSSEVTFMASQTDLPFLWFNNEEQGNKVKIRCFQAALGLNSSKLFHERTQNQERYRNLVGDRIRIYDSASIHKRDVERICKDLRPALIVFDQIDKIKGFQEDRQDLELGAIYIWARELAKEYCPVIGVCQAGSTAHNKKYPDMNDVVNAKTSKQAEADWIIGIGKEEGAGMEDVRGLNICKNKLTGDEDTIPDWRHAKLDVMILPTIGRYKDIMRFV